jgi:hypothetical protein
MTTSSWSAIHQVAWKKEQKFLLWGCISFDMWTNKTNDKPI